MSLEKYPVKRVADQVWDETAAEHIATGSMGKVSKDTSDNVLAIKDKTDNLSSDPADESLLEAKITSEVDNLITRSKGLDDIYDDLTGKALASVATEGRLSELDAANIPADLDLVKGDTPYIHDQAISSPVIGSVAERIERLEGAVQEGTYSLPSGTTEQDAVVITVSAKTKLQSIFLDLVNLTKGCTLRLYHKIDGTNYREIDSLDWDTGMRDGVEILACMVDHDVKVTIQSNEAEGSARDIPYTVNKEAMA